MKKLFAYITLILGIWLMISPWLLNYSGEPVPRWHDILVGFIIVSSALVFILRKPASANWANVVNIIFGLWLFISGIFFFGQTSTATRWNEIAAGILVTLFSAIATQIIEGKKGNIYTKEGVVLVEMSRMVYKNGIIEIKGKAYGSMPQVMHIRPEEIWYMLGLIPLELVLNLPKLLYLGWRKSKETVGAIDSNESSKFVK